MRSRITTSARGNRGVRSKALDAAASILAAEGLEGLSLKAIAEGAGIGIGSIYYYFHGKEELLLSLATSGWADLATALSDESVWRDPVNPLGGVARAYFGYAERHPALFSLMYDERMMARHEGLREAERRTFLAFQAVVQSDERFPPALRESTALALWALGRGMAAMTSSQPDGRLDPDLATKVWDGVRYLVGRTQAG